MRPVLMLLVMVSACGGPGNEADEVGVGGECSVELACPLLGDDSGEPELACLTQFAGGYCGLSDCEANDDCPDGSACVAHDDGNTYCFRQCDDKPECNLNRTEDHEANCSSSVTFVEPDTPGKACVPPSSGS